MSATEASGTAGTAGALEDVDLAGERRRFHFHQTYGGVWDASGNLDPESGHVISTALRSHVHWADGGVTSLSNLILLRREHHGAVHEGKHPPDRWRERGRCQFDELVMARPIKRTMNMTVIPR